MGGPYTVAKALLLKWILKIFHKLGAQLLQGQVYAFVSLTDCMFVGSFYSLWLQGLSLLHFITLHCEDHFINPGFWGGNNTKCCFYGYNLSFYTDHMCVDKYSDLQPNNINPGVFNLLNVVFLLLQRFSTVFKSHLTLNIIFARYM